MDMAGAAGIGAGHDAAQSIAPFRVGELMAAQAETGIVVPALVVGLPEIQQGSRVGLQARESTKPTSSMGCPAMPVSSSSTRSGEDGLKIRPFGLPQGCFVAVVAGRRRGKRRLSDAAIDREP